MKNEQTLYFHQGQLKFSAGHFTIFSETERENLHGHNYYLEAAVTTCIEEPGITFDYRILKDRLKLLCDQLDSRFLLPTQSPYLKIEEDGEYIYATFDQKKLPFLKQDVMLLPLSNVTLEELSRWFIERMAEEDLLIEHPISRIEIKVFNGLEHSAVFSWFRENNYLRP